jgi:hypothetical protein
VSVPTPPSATEPVALVAHLRAWLGVWPPAGAVEVIGSRARTAPAWDGRIHPLVGVLAPAGGVLSVPPDAAAAVRALLPGDGWRAAVPALVGAPERAVEETVFRYTAAPAPLEDVGAWLPAGHPAVPSWLRPFGGDVLVVLDAGGRYLAGVGCKRHDAAGVELAVGTEQAARGAGLARRLVAQAARAVLAAGAIPTYRHDPANAASARVAEAAGFPDRGWRHVALVEEA